MSSKSEIVDGTVTAVEAATDITAATSPKLPKDDKRESSREKDRDREKDRERRSRPDIERSKSHRERDSKRDSKTKEKDKDRRSSKSLAASTIFSKLRATDSETSHASSVRRAHSHHHRSSKVGTESDVMLDVPRMFNPSVSSDRISVPYPSFSKTHSKEAVGSREDISTPSQVRKSSGSTATINENVNSNGDPITPDATDLGSSAARKRHSANMTSTTSRTSHHRSRSVDSIHDRRSTSGKSRGDTRPPSPPETDVTSPKPHSSTVRSSRSRRSDADTITDMRPKSRVSELSRSESKLSRRKSTSSSRLSTHSTAVPRSSSSRDSLRSKDIERLSRSGSKSSHLSRRSSASHRSSGSNSTVKKRSSSDRHHEGSSLRYQRSSSPDTVQGSSPKTPTQPASAVFPADGLSVEEIPRVDYLMQNGGLPQAVSKQFLSVLSQNRVQRTAQNVPPLVGAESFFTPFFNLLDQYNSVLAKHGSIAVATGHRSVARRLLDRLEHVFSRDLPAEGCSCVVCERSDIPHRGLNWGEVLEQVSGRANLPMWPPFDIGSLGIKAVGSHIDPDAPPRPSSPINLDPDLNEEFREHYLRQTQKVRQAVDRWMTKCADAPAPPPTEIDDETLTFAILTNLNTDDKPFFNALLTGSRELQPALRAPTPFRKNRSEFITKSGAALQLLYSLEMAPRDAEVALFLIKYPETHDLLTTISAINPSEWEILTSGRFDGFLWSGADNGDLSPGGPMSPDRGDGVNSRMSFSGSRAATPLQRPYSRSATATPASFISNATAAGPVNKQAVSVDEEAEIATLNELELEIFNGMEALENAFETLHLHAQSVRNALRQRAAGLTQSLQSRKRPEVLPGSGNSFASGYERPAWAQGPEGDDGSDGDWADDIDMIAPDDSASNVASNRRHQTKRRQERRTPAPIEEEDEDY